MVIVYTDGLFVTPPWQTCTFSAKNKPVKCDSCNSASWGAHHQNRAEDLFHWCWLLCAAPSGGDLGCGVGRRTVTAADRTGGWGEPANEQMSVSRLLSAPAVLE